MNDNLRNDLSRLESRVEDLARDQLSHAEKEQGTALGEVAPTNDAAVAVMSPMAATAVAGGEEGGGSREDTEEVAAMREELHALRRKVEIIAANVLGEAENVIMDITAGTSAAGNVENQPREQEELPRCDAGRDDARNTADEAETVADETSTDGDKESKTDGPEAKKEERGIVGQSGEDSGLGNAVVLPRCVRARNRWVKVRMHRAFLVRKIRRQVRVCNT